MNFYKKLQNKEELKLSLNMTYHKTMLFKFLNNKIKPRCNL